MRLCWDPSCTQTHWQNCLLPQRKGECFSGCEKMVWEVWRRWCFFVLSHVHCSLLLVWHLFFPLFFSLKALSCLAFLWCPAAHCSSPSPCLVMSSGDRDWRQCPYFKRMPVSFPALCFSQWIGFGVQQHRLLVHQQPFCRCLLHFWPPHWAWKWKFLERRKKVWSTTK